MNLLRGTVAALALLVGLGGPTGLATAAQLPSCSVATTLKAPANPVAAGRRAKIKLAVQTTEWG